jgi:O-6-methylguanine DNA methyltransferase
MPMRVLRYEAPGWGVGELALEDGRLLYHELPVPRAAPERVAPRRGSAATRGPNHPQGIPEIPAVTVARKSARVGDDSVPELLRRLQAYFDGATGRFDDVELELDWCTPFQRSLLDALRSVPRGETVTYGELAALAGRPNAPRAAGSLCARNRFAIVVPCHRVVAAGGLGSYGSLGLAYKRRLLELEGADAAL